MRRQLAGVLTTTPAIDYNAPLFLPFTRANTNQHSNMPKTTNPIYPRWADPFFGMSSEYIVRAGDGDFNRGYDKILDNFIAHWNAQAQVNRFMPPTSRERGMEWIPDTAKMAAEAQRIRARRVAETQKRRDGEDQSD